MIARGKRAARRPWIKIKKTGMSPERAKYVGPSGLDHFFVGLIQGRRAVALAPGFHMSRLRRWGCMLTSPVALAPWLSHVAPSALGCMLTSAARLPLAFICRAFGAGGCMLTSAARFAPWLSYVAPSALGMHVDQRCACLSLATILRTFGAGLLHANLEHCIHDGEDEGG